jgi:hypothetical protein
MKVKTKVKAGSMTDGSSNTRATAHARGLRVKTGVKAGDVHIGKDLQSSGIV